MRRTFKHCTKARLSFSGGPHTPVNMADSMENAGSWTVSVSKEAMEVPRNFKDLRAKYSTVQRSKQAIFCVFLHLHSLLPCYPPCLQER